MDQNILKQFGEITLDKMSALNVSITSYCPRIFKTLMKRDGFANITTFLNPKANKESI